MQMIKINSEKQENGLWGMPLRVTEIKNNGGINEKNQLLLSAIIIKFAEHYPDSYFSLDIRENQLFVKRESNGNSKNHMIHLDDYEVIDNTLYYIPNDLDKRFLKLMRINKKINVL